MRRSDRPSIATHDARLRVRKIERKMATKERQIARHKGITGIGKLYWERDQLMLEHLAASKLLRQLEERERENAQLEAVSDD